MAYQFVRHIGSGAFGDVSLCKSSDGGYVAIKLLRKLSPDALRRLRREARALIGQRNNPFVIRILDCNLTSNPPFIVLEYADGGSLRKYCQSPNDWRWVVRISKHIAKALISVHGCGGFHRDIKPDNLLLVRNPQTRLISVKLGDFGLVADPSTRSTMMTASPFGTPAYMAPELSCGWQFHQGADIYSFGVVINELLAGTRNFHDLTSIRVPKELVELVALCVSSNTDERPTAHQVLQVLGAIETFYG